jgi:dihydrofolate reductase
MPKVSIICAMSENRAIGKDNKLLWDIPEDLKFFRETTLNHPIIMGRKTFESIGRALPKRTNIVITRNPAYQADGITTVKNLEEAISFAKKEEEEEIFIIGGGQIYKEALNYADTLYLTIVKGSFEADTFFPEYSSFKEVYRESYNNGKHKFDFATLSKRL